MSNLRTSTLALLLGAFLAAPADGQLQIVGYGAGEWDMEEVSVYVLGLGVQTTRLGWGPAANLMLYMVDREYVIEPAVGTVSDRITAFNPSVGLQHRRATSASQLRVGYAFVDTDENTVPGLPSYGGAQSGLTTTGQFNHWGDGTTSTEVIANVNWGDPYFWGRARGTRRISGTDPARGVNLGGELALQGNEDYRALQIGPLVELQRGALKLIGGAGYKLQETFDNTAYFRAEFVFVH